MRSWNLAVLKKGGIHLAIKKAVVAKPPQTLTDFIEAFAQYSSKSNLLNCYRGQRDASWRNVAGIFRPDLRELLKNEKRAVRDLVSVHPNEFAADETMFDRLVRMQHFGLPTRLLDVSLNALVALYFATDPSPEGSAPTDGKVTAFAVHEEREKYYDSDSVSCLANLANMTADEKLEIDQARERLRSVPDDRRITVFNEEGVMLRLLQFIRSEKAYFLPIVDPIDLYRPYFVHPKMSNRRILAQSGAFIIHGLRQPARMYFPRPIEETDFIMPAASKSGVRQALESLGINQSTLFPEIDKAANRIMNRYLRK